VPQLKKLWAYGFDVENTNPFSRIYCKSLRSIELYGNADALINAVKEAQKLWGQSIVKLSYLFQGIYGVWDNEFDWTKFPKLKTLKGFVENSNQALRFLKSGLHLDLVSLFIARKCMPLQEVSEIVMNAPLNCTLTLFVNCLGHNSAQTHFYELLFDPEDLKELRRQVEAGEFQHISVLDYDQNVSVVDIDLESKNEDEDEDDVLSIDYLNGSLTVLVALF
jgi:hypothetical protein